MKTCSTCQIQKDDLCFHVNNRGGIGSRRAECIACHGAKMKLHYIKTRASHRAREKHHVHTPIGWATTTLMGMRKSSKRRNHKEICFLSSVEVLVWASSKKNFRSLWSSWVASGYERMARPSIDRLDNSLGYVPGNMRLVSWRENLHSWTSSEGHKKALVAARLKNPNHIKHHSR